MDIMPNIIITLCLLGLTLAKMPTDTQIKVNYGIGGGVEMSAYTTFGACFLGCEEDPTNCLAVDFYGDEQRCFFFSSDLGCNPTVPMPNTVHAKLIPCPPRTLYIDTFHAQMIEGGEHIPDALTALGCLEACSMLPDCKGVSFNTVTMMCYLHFEEECEPFSENADFVHYRVTNECGAVSPPQPGLPMGIPTGYLSVEYGMTLDGGMTMPSMMTYQQCIDVCFSLPTCLVAAYKNNTMAPCTLHNYTSSCKPPSAEPFTSLFYRIVSSCPMRVKAASYGMGPIGYSDSFSNVASLKDCLKRCVGAGTLKCQGTVYYTETMTCNTILADHICDVPVMLPNAYFMSEVFCKYSGFMTANTDWPPPADLPSGWLGYPGSTAAATPPSHSIPFIPVASCIQLCESFMTEPDRPDCYAVNYSTRDGKCEFLTEVGKCDALTADSAIYHIKVPEQCPGTGDTYPEPIVVGLGLPVVG